MGELTIAEAHYTLMHGINTDIHAKEYDMDPSPNNDQNEAIQ